MGELLAYSIEGGVLLLAMFLAYRLTLAQENQPGYNRGVLLAIYVVAFASLPMWSLAQKLTTPEASQMAMVDNVEIVDTILTPMSQHVWGRVILWSYIGGIAIVLTNTLLTWVRLLRIVHNGKKVFKEGFTLVLTDDERLAPFSWMRYVVVSRANCESAILDHELKHIACHHWVDLIVAQVVCVVNWFNPAAWLMREELMLVHKYQADMAVIDHGHSPLEYQMLLVKKAVGARFPSLANSLNHSKLKKRITMMYKSPCGARRRWRALALVPALGLALGLMAVPAISAAVSTISSSSLSVDKGTEISDPEQVNKSTAPAIPVVETAEVMPQYPGGELAMFQALNESVDFPNPEQLRGWGSDADGLTVVGFVVNEDGNPTDFSIIKSCGYSDLDQAAIDGVKKAVSVKWTPASDHGKPVAVSFALPVKFKQQ
ncbi:MAG: M56 family metallopeptidase [Bacteroidales bacterium]|nr:M56 family metallopeptidase [Bacteroidales bacterium]